MFETRSEVEQLLAVAEAGRIVAAAARLSMTQPALTRAIAKLERCAGGALFERLPTGVRLTALGAAARDRARRLRREFADAQEHIAEALAGREGRFRIAAAPLWMRAVVVPAALRFQEKWPGVGLTFRSVPFAEGVRLLEAGECDLHVGGVDGGRPLPKFLRREPLLRETAGIVARRGHPLRSRRTTPEDLVRSPGSTAARRRTPARMRAGRRSPRCSRGSASARASAPGRCCAWARRACTSSPRGRGSPGCRSPCSPACPRSASSPADRVRRRRYRTGLIARRLGRGPRADAGVRGDGARGRARRAPLSGRLDRSLGAVANETGIRAASACARTIRRRSHSGEPLSVAGYGNGKASADGLATPRPAPESLKYRENHPSNIVSTLTAPKP